MLSTSIANCAACCIQALYLHLATCTLNISHQLLTLTPKLPTTHAPRRGPTPHTLNPQPKPKPEPEPPTPEPAAPDP